MFHSSSNLLEQPLSTNSRPLSCLRIRCSTLINEHIHHFESSYLNHLEVTSSLEVSDQKFPLEMPTRPILDRPDLFRYFWTDQTPWTDQTSLCSSWTDQDPPEPTRLPPQPSGPIKPTSSKTQSKPTRICFHLTDQDLHPSDRPAPSDRPGETDQLHQIDQLL